MIAGFLAAFGAGLGDVGAVRGERFVHDRLVQAHLAAAAALDEGEVAASFGEQVAAVEVAAAVHHEHAGGDRDGRQADVDHGRDPGPDHGSRGAGALEEGVDEADGVGEERACTPVPVLAQLRKGAGPRLRGAGLAGGYPVQLRPCPLGDLRCELEVAVVVGGGDVLVLQLCQAGGDLRAAAGGPADQLVRDAGDFHDRTAASRDGAGLGGQPQRLARLHHHDLVVERGGGDDRLQQRRGVHRCRVSPLVTCRSRVTWAFLAVSRPCHP
ncbi:hypothetical protein SGFS_003110 [Streptomyces graminofaciens]|uniref:Uncharacterized protein n=1 Tax=Streptomyces graminofaciens TaxID=68212 RepID=A0ABN5V6R4_9ACTN|nr:hypothetical protein [Streptomyces graminofaciens]BBC29020.1 hypothetical protein SGFS_003110 [Streptomyces graminofaciens]